MGQKVLATQVTSAEHLRAYAHCANDTNQGGVTLLLINLAKDTEYEVDIRGLTGEIYFIVFCMCC
jgi:hypothetical protein